MSKATKGLQTAKFKVKKGDEVIVITGKDKGKKGKVLKMMPQDAKLIVEGVALHKRHLRGRAQGQVGSIAERPSAIHVSNVKKVGA